MQRIIISRYVNTYIELYPGIVLVNIDGGLLTNVGANVDQMHHPPPNKQTHHANCPGGNVP